MNNRQYVDGYLAGMIDADEDTIRKIPLARYHRDYGQGYHDGVQGLPERTDEPTNPWSR